MGNQPGKKNNNKNKKKNKKNAWTKRRIFTTNPPTVNSSKTHQNPISEIIRIFLHYAGVTFETSECNDSFCGSIEPFVYKSFAYASIMASKKRLMAVRVGLRMMFYRGIMNPKNHDTFYFALLESFTDKEILQILKDGFLGITTRHNSWMHKEIFEKLHICFGGINKFPELRGSIFFAKHEEFVKAGVEPGFFLLPGAALRADLQAMNEQYACDALRVFFQYQQRNKNVQKLFRAALYYGFAKIFCIQ